MSEIGLFGGVDFAELQLGLFFCQLGGGLRELGREGLAVSTPWCVCNFETEFVKTRPLTTSNVKPKKILQRSTLKCVSNQSEGKARCLPKW